MVETIWEPFNPEILPTWARKRPEVVALCERSLAYRCDVCAARGSERDPWIQHLIRKAEGSGKKWG